MLAIIGNLHMTELLVIALAALMIFGRRLPEVAMRGAAHVVRLRRSVTKMWREAGLEEELRKVRRDIDNEVHQVQRSLPRLDAPDDNLDESGAVAPQHEHWRDNIHSELPEDEREDRDPLAREGLDGEPAEEAVRQEGEVDDPPQESGLAEEEPDEPVEAKDSDKTVEAVEPVEPNEPVEPDEIEETGTKEPA